jgi:hypothetical protein
MAIDIRPADWNSFSVIMGEKGGCGGCLITRLNWKAQMDCGGEID